MRSLGATMPGVLETRFRRSLIVPKRARQSLDRRSSSDASEVLSGVRTSWRSSSPIAGCDAVLQPTGIRTRSDVSQSDTPGKHLSFLAWMRFSPTRDFITLPPDHLPAVRVFALAIERPEADRPRDRHGLRVEADLVVARLIGERAGDGHVRPIRDGRGSLG